MLLKLAEKLDAHAERAECDSRSCVVYWTLAEICRKTYEEEREAAKQRLPFTVWLNW